jgi:hypothetical protein
LLDAPAPRLPGAWRIRSVGALAILTYQLTIAENARSVLQCIGIFLSSNQNVHGASLLEAGDAFASARVNSEMSAQGVNTYRRRVLVATTGLLGAVGAGVTAVPFISALNPSAAARAAGAPVEADVSQLEPGALLRVKWRGQPIWIVHRTPEMLAALPTLDGRLVDPASDVPQQPEYCKNPTRSIKPEYLVAIEHLAQYYAPKNFNFWYFFGSLAMLVLVIQIVTGIFLTMHYKPDAAQAFASVEYIMRDVPWGWLIRYMHSTGASAFFIVVYLHMFRGCSTAPTASRASSCGSSAVVIFLA